MKKSPLFGGMTLFAFFLVGCKSSKSQDLLLFELNGNVKSVTNITITNVDSEGQWTQYSNEYKGDRYEFDKNGHITKGSDSFGAFKVSRNYKRQIKTISVPDTYIKSYQYNSLGYPIEEQCIFSIAGVGGYTCEIIYNTSKLNETMDINAPNPNEVVGRKYRCWIPLMSEDSVYKYNRFVNYTILTIDMHGNWTERFCQLKDHSTEGDYIEKRVISYYESNK